MLGTPPPKRMPPPEYVTTDIYLTSFLVHRGSVLHGLRRLGPKRVEFRLAANPQLHHLLRLYWSGVMTPVVPWELFATYHRLKCQSITRDK